MVTEEIREATCLACGHHVAVSFIKPRKQPLATIAWPMDEHSAKNQPRLPLDFIQCVNCGHVFNAAYDYSNVPYPRHPNLMFNKGINWAEFIQRIQEKILYYISATPIVVEIGHGDGSFLSSIATLCPEGTFIGFDPHGVKKTHEMHQCENLSFRTEIFDPVHQFKELKPDIIISRHVLEHLTNPLGFLQRLSFVANYYNLEPYTYLEVPCIDRVLDTGRTVDFYYEHSSHFTTQSFTEMLKRSTQKIEEIGHGYDSEVIFAVSKISHIKKSIEIANNSMCFYENAENSLNNIKTQLEDLHSSGKKIAIWGGTGKSCAFICRYGLDSMRFPLVIDSDIEKVGTFVPGMGQEIKFRDWLRENPVDVVIIPPQWRAKDIIQEMEINQITYETILIEHGGVLIDFLKESHPYCVFR